MNHLETERKIRRQTLGLKEAARARHAEEETKIIFVNIGLGRQKTAKNFWVSLPEALPIKRIREIVERAFGDLDEVVR